MCWRGKGTHAQEPVGGRARSAVFSAARAWLRSCTSSSSTHSSRSTASPSSTLTATQHHQTLAQLPDRVRYKGTSPSYALTAKQHHQTSAQPPDSVHDWMPMYSNKVKEQGSLILLKCLMMRLPVKSCVTHDSICISYLCLDNALGAASSH